MSCRRSPRLIWLTRLQVGAQGLIRLVAQASRDGRDAGRRRRDTGGREDGAAVEHDRKSSSLSLTGGHINNVKMRPTCQYSSALTALRGQPTRLIGAVASEPNPRNYVRLRLAFSLYCF